MSKGEQTRERIIEQTAPLFNQLGFSGASLSDVMKATGLKKGGIYNHFESKEELALEAFDHAVGCVGKRMADLLESKKNAVEKLLAFAQVFWDSLANPPIAGGCPLLNTAIESDDAHPALRAKAQQAMDGWRQEIKNVVLEGISSGAFRPEVDGEIVASRLIATLEGGTMMSRLYGDPVHVRRAVDFITEYIHREVVA